MATRRRRLRRTRRPKQRGGRLQHTAVVIEPRKSMQKALEFVTHNILENLPKSWSVILFSGKENDSEVKEFVKRLSPSEHSRVSVKSLGLDTMDTARYNTLMMSRRILDAIPTEVFLIVQTDSMLCKGGSDILQKFMKYDYVGAPWKATATVGNGGFSLRRKTKMLEILDKCPTLNHNEDGFFSTGCEGAIPSKPSAEEAEEFSVETIFNGKQPFGIHKAWYHLSEKQEQLEDKCLGYTSLKNLNTL